MHNFSYYQPTRLHFATGGINRVAQQVATYGKRCLLVSAPVIDEMKATYDAISALLMKKGITVTHFSEVVANPSTRVIEAGWQMSRQNQCDVVLAVGGGSSIDSGKVIAATHYADKIDWQCWFANYQSAFSCKPLPEKCLPLIAIPTTSGTGSHVTHAAVITDLAKQAKFTLFHPDFFPREAIIDPELMLTLPARMTAITGFDAFAHAFESFTGARSSPFVDNMALQAMRLIIRYLPEVVKNGADLAGRIQLAIADTFAGIALTNGGAGAPHPIGEILGGHTNMPHGLTLSVIYPAYIRLQWKKQVERFAMIAELFGATGSSQQKAAALENVLVSFLQQIGLETHLAQVGLTAEEVKALEPALCFDLPFTTGEEMKQILRDSLYEG